MIIGTGIDLVQITRIEQLLQKFPKIFPQKILCKSELKLYENLSDNKQPSFIAKRFSVKESIIKATSTLNTKLNFLDMEILNEKSGKPYVKLRNDSILSNYKIDISISDDYPCAVSMAIVTVSKYEVLTK